MFYKLILSILFAVLCLGCSKKSVEDDMHGDLDLETCSENPSLPGCDDGPKVIHCYEISSVGPCRGGFNPHIYVETKAAGSVQDFNWLNTLPWYYETENYPYGFDKDPMSNWPDRVESGRDVYVSVASDDIASVDLKIPPEYTKTISLVKVDDGTVICSGSACQATHSLEAGDYKLMNGTEDMDRNLHIISYDKKEPYEITYIQFDGEGGKTCTVDEGCYTHLSVQENLNKILSQAVLSANLNKANPIDIGLGNIFEVDMTEKFDELFYTTLVNNMLHKGVTRTVFAINSVRLVWRLDNPASLLSMNNYYDFAKAYSKNNKIAIEDGGLAPMFMKSYSNTCATGVGITPVPVYAKLISHNDKDNVFSVSLQDYAGRPVSFSADCDYLYIDSYGFIPGEKGVAQIMWPFGVEETIDGKKINKVTGGVAFAVRQSGEYSKNTIVHEIGHSFGLSDIYIDPEDPSIAYCYQKTADGYYARDDIPLTYADGSLVDFSGMLIDNHFVYSRCNYTTSEADLMNYQVPTGPRLRYRLMPIVGTGSNIPNGTYDSQWECLRNADCGRYK